VRQDSGAFGFWEDLVAAVKAKGWINLKPLLKLSSRFWSGPTATQAWMLTCGAFTFSLADVGIQLMLNRWNRDFYDALEVRSASLIEAAALSFVVLVAAATFTVMAATACKIFLQVGWRQFLSGEAVAAWLDDRAFYRLTILRGTDFAPEHRIAEDVRLTIEPVVDLSIGFMAAIATVLSFAAVLWTAGGSIVLGGVTIPGFMVFVAISHAALVSGAMAIFGRNYAQRIRDRSEAEARFRYELTRLRENAESVALMSGEAKEKTLLAGYLKTLTRSWRNYASTWTKMTWVTYTNGLVAPVLPLLIMTPNYLSGGVTLGTMVQTATAYGIFQASLSWFPSNFARLSEWYAAASRVAELLSFIDLAADGSAKSQITVSKGTDDKLRLTNVSITLYDGTALIADTDLVVTPGEMVLVNGDSGAGKSMLVRAIAGLWPWGSGQISLPAGATIAFLPQRCYVPNGSLRAAITYPESPDAVPDVAILWALEMTGLGHLSHSLDLARPWDKFLSGGEMQRLAFARVLIQRPTIVILDEATSALDPANEARMMDLFTHHLFATTVVSVAHRPSLAAYHNRVITVRRRGGSSGVESDEAAVTVQQRMRQALVDIQRTMKPR
jgi:vitamin B12/bleomycin/antimicrobial peptide transport system ATP-binding/permease protein